MDESAGKAVSVDKAAITAEGSLPSLRTGMEVEGLPSLMRPQ